MSEGNYGTNWEGFELDAGELERFCHGWERSFAKHFVYPWIRQHILRRKYLGQLHFLRREQQYSFLFFPCYCDRYVHAAPLAFQCLIFMFCQNVNEDVYIFSPEKRVCWRFDPLLVSLEIGICWLCVPKILHLLIKCIHSWSSRCLGKWNKVKYCFMSVHNALLLLKTKKWSLYLNRFQLLYSYLSVVYLLK